MRAAARTRTMRGRKSVFRADMSSIAALSGTVVKGFGRGSKELGIPTGANVHAHASTYTGGVGSLAFCACEQRTSTNTSSSRCPSP